MEKLLCGSKYLIKVDALNSNHSMIGTSIIGEVFVIRRPCHLLLTYVNDVVLGFLLLTLNTFCIFF